MWCFGTNNSNIDEKSRAKCQIQQTANTKFNTIIALYWSLATPLHKCVKETTLSVIVCKWWELLIYSYNLFYNSSKLKCYTKASTRCEVYCTSFVKILLKLDHKYNRRNWCIYTIRNCSQLQKLLIWINYSLFCIQTGDGIWYKLYTQTWWRMINKVNEMNGRKHSP